jgi:biopolymer transport protein ExbB/TolQ
VPALLVALTVASTALLLVVLVALVRQARRLSGAVRRFRAEVDPLLQEIRADADRARDRLDALSRPRLLTRGPQRSDRGRG